MQDDFSRQFRSISNTELLDILENADEYQPEALAAAKAELASRNLTPEAIELARQPLIEKRHKKDKERQKVKAIEEKIKKAGNNVFDTLNPIQTGIPSAEKKIRLIVIIFGGLFLYGFLKNIRENIYLLKDFSSYPFLTGITFLLFFFLPVAVFTFWRRKKTGWTLLSIFLIYSIINTGWMVYEALTWKSSGFIAVDNIFPHPSPVKFYLPLLLFGSTLFVICQKDIREIYQLTRTRMLETIAVTAFTSFLLVLAISHA